MSIWIRSQNGHVLVEAQSVTINQDTGENEIHYIFADNKWLVGKYDSEAEALAVLDMIEEEIGHQERVRLFPNETWEMPRIVFQMPEKEAAAIEG